MSNTTPDAAQYLGDIPHNPEHYMVWTDAEREAIRAYAIAAVQRALAARECAVSLALEVLRDNNRWHIDYDEHGSYDDSELQSRNLAAIHALEQIGAAPQQAAPAAKAPLPPYYISGPYQDGACAVCETAKGRVLRKFVGEADLLLAAGTKQVHVGLQSFTITDVAQAAPAGQAAAPPQNCGDCRNADSWGIPLDKTCKMTCRPTPEGGSRYVSINAKPAPAVRLTDASLADLVVDEPRCMALLNALDTAAKAQNSYEYGLPLRDDGQAAALREVVYRWAANGLRGE